MITFVATINMASIDFTVHHMELVIIYKSYRKRLNFMIKEEYINTKFCNSQWSNDGRLAIAS
jgi:hypothetical protein